MGFADHDVRVLLARAFKPVIDGLTFMAAGAALMEGLVHLLPPLAAVVSILWMGFQWYHSAPMKEWRTRRREREAARGCRPASVLRSVAVWCNAMLLALLSFTSDIAQALTTYLPSLAPYLPEHLQKWVGLTVVLLNIVNAIRHKHKNASTRGRHGE